MICIFEPVNMFTDETWDSWLELLCPWEYVKEVKTENEEHCCDYKAKDECGGRAELECRTESANRAAKNEERGEPADMK